MQKLSQYYKIYGIFIFILFFCDNQGTFHGQALKTLHGDPNLGVLTTSQQLAPGKFKVSLVVEFKPKTMYHLLGPHFPVFTLTNWATLVGKIYGNNTSIK